MLLRDCRQLRSLRERHEANRYHRGGLLEWRRVKELFSDLERENQLILHAVGEGIYGVDAEGGPPSSIPRRNACWAGARTN